MDLNAAGLDWDSGNRDKCRRHGVSLVEIESIFRRSVAVFPDPQHSGVERRFKAIGISATGRHIFVVFTLRARSSASYIRPISARYMHRKEIEHYERQQKETEEASGAADG
jgi:uncharacterized protein